MNAAELQGGDDPLDYGRGPGDMPISRDQLDERSIIRHPALGGDTRLVDLVSWGWVRKSAHGPEWTEQGKEALGLGPFAGSASQQQQQQRGAQTETEKNDAPSMERLSDQSEAIISEAVSKIGDTPVRALMETVISGNDPEPFIGELAARLAVEPDEFRSRIESVTQEFTEHARRSLGLDAESFEKFTEWAQSPERRRETHEGIWRYVEFGDLRALRKLGQEFASTGAQWDDESVLSADFGSGITAHRADDGKVILAIPGKGTMTLKQALSLGIVKVSPR
jgi:hypothetical protein